MEPIIESTGKFYIKSEGIGIYETEPSITIGGDTADATIKTEPEISIFDCPTSSSLSTDIGRVSSVEKPFSCDECGMQFAKKLNLTAHQNIHSGKRTFNCDECGKNFNRKDSLIIHQRTHAGETPFDCDECDSKFTTKYARRQHKKHMHSNIS